MNVENGILNVSIFGSYGRGNHDTRSDLDVLVVCQDGAGTQSDDAVRATIAREFDKTPSISWYGDKRMAHFFSTGDLFAWHLYTESYPLPGYKSVAEIFGRPEPYLNCLYDIRGLRDILSSIPDQIAKNPQNLIYELGLAYVCLRNIAMTASSVLCETAIFSRSSPFELPEIGQPMSKADYDLLTQCRHASTRGTQAPEFDIDVSTVLQKCLYWAEVVERKVL